MKKRGWQQHHSTCDFQGNKHDTHLYHTVRSNYSVRLNRKIFPTTCRPQKDEQCSHPS